MYHTLTKEEIYTALDERHSPETQKLLSAGNVAIAGLGGLGACTDWCRSSSPD